MASVDPFFLAVIQWHPRLGGLWCGVVIFALAAWLYFLHQRLRRRHSPIRARWLLLPKCLTALALLFALFNPVSALQKNEAAKGKVLVLVDDSSSMDVADDYQQPRVARARKIVEAWKDGLPKDVHLDLADFDTTIHAADSTKPTAVRNTDLGACLLALAERNDVASYLGVVLLTDGGDEVLDNPVLPKLPLHVVGIGSDPAGWNDVAIAGVDCPTTVEKDTGFEMTADLQARAGHGGDFARKLSQVGLLLERETGTNNWTRVSRQPVDLSNLRQVVHLPLKSADVGVQRYRLSLEPVAGELSQLNNTREVTVNVQKKSLHVLFFAESLGQEFKVLRNELAHDPGIAFTALFRTTANRYLLQGDRQAGDDALTAGFPASAKGLAGYDAVVLGSFPASDFSARQMQALSQFCENGGAVLFLGGDNSFGRGGYAASPLAALLPWHITDQEAEPAHGNFPVGVSPMGTGSPILAGVEEVLARRSVPLDTVNLVGDLKPGAQALLSTHVDGRDLPVVAMQPFGKGKVLGIATSTLWKWALQPEPVRPVYGLLWRQAVRVLTGQTEGGQHLALHWDKEFYRPGETAVGQIRALGPEAATVRFTAELEAKGQTVPVTLEPAPGDEQAFQVKLRFRERADYNFRLVAYQGDRVLETYKKHFPVAAQLPEGARLEPDELFLKKLAEDGGGSYFREDEASRFPELFSEKNARKVTVKEVALAEAGPWFLLVFLGLLAGEWILRRKFNLF